MTIGDRIKELQKENGITQVQFAERLNIAQSTVSGWETNLFEPTANAIVDICREFMISADYLLGLEDESGTKLFP